MAMNRVEQCELDLAKLNLQKDDCNHREGCATSPEVFQELVNIRKVERNRKAEEKRQEGLRRITEMNSDRNLDPLLPKETWAILLAEDKDMTPKKRATICKMHSIFRGLLEENRIRDILFPLVLDYNLPFLGPLLRFRSNANLDMKQIKNLRLVSKEVRESMDKWIENDLLNSMKEMSHSSSYRPPVNPVKFTLFRTSDDHITKLSREMKKLFTRSFTVEFMDFASSRSSDDDIDFDISRRKNQDALILFKDHVSELLRKVGDQILYFNLSFLQLRIESKKEHGLNIIQIYSILRQYLLLMPNLKWMQLTAGMRVFHPGDPFEHLPNWLASANAALQAAPVPRIDGLERVDFAEWRDFPVWNPFLTANMHVKYHKFDRGGWYAIDELERHTDPLVLSLPLEHLNSENRPWNLTLLQQVSDQSSWKLKRVGLKIQGFEMDGVFRYLQKFQALEELRVNIIDFAVKQKMNFLNLPNLKKLNLFLGTGLEIEESSEFHFFYSLQFLLHCSKMESITWETGLNATRKTWYKMQETGLNLDGGMIDFKGGWEDLSGSNIWDVFPLLRSVNVSLWHEGDDESGDDDNEEEEDDDSLDDLNDVNYYYYCEPWKRKYRYRKLVYEENSYLKDFKSA